MVNAHNLNNSFPKLNSKLLHDSYKAAGRRRPWSRMQNLNNKMCNYIISS